MKKPILYIISLLLLVLHPFVSQAQTFHAGPNIGSGISLVNYQNDDFQQQFDSKIKPTFRAGLSFLVPLTDFFVLSPELNYGLRGRKVFVQENGWTLKEYHHFIEFPLTLNISRESSIRQIGPLKNIGPFTWYFGIGPNLSYMLGGFGTLDTYGIDSKYKVSFGGKESDYNYISFKPANRLQWGIDINLAISTPLYNSQELLTTIKYTHGHTNLGPPDGSNMPILGFTDNIAHNYKMLTLSFAYLFYLDPSQLLKGKSTKGEKIKTKNVSGGRKRKRR